MQVAKFELQSDEQRVGVLVDDRIQLIRQTDDRRSLTDLLHSDDPVKWIRSLLDPSAAQIARSEVRMLAPLDRQEVVLRVRNLLRTRRLYVELANTNTALKKRLSAV